MRTALATYVMILMSCPAGALHAQDSWKAYLDRAAMPARIDHAAAFDPVRKHMVVFGGWAPGPMGDTWVWDGLGWKQMYPKTPPPARAFHDMAYDPVNQRILLFSGKGSQGPLADTWSWDGSQWAMLKPAQSPSSREWGRMVTDTHRKRVVLFGGTTASNQVWEWDGQTWLAPTTVKAPPARYGHSMAYDELRRRVVLFSGRYLSGGSERADLWEWDGKTWTQIQASPMPPGRIHGCMAYDATRKMVLLYGGEKVYGATTPMTQTWGWDGKNWSKLTPTFSPPGLTRSVMVFDGRSSQITLIGGYGGSPVKHLSGHWRLEKPTGFLHADSDAISVSQGGTHRLALEAGSLHRNSVFVLVGSLSGTSPGIGLGGCTLPLNFDLYLGLTLDLANSGIYVGSVGVLDGVGSARASVVMPAGLAAGLRGRTAHHAFAVFQGYGCRFASNAVAMDFLK